MRNHAKQRQPVHALPPQEVGGVAFLLLEDEDEQAAAVHVLRARHRGVHHRLLDHAVEAERRLRLDGGGGRHGRKCLEQHLVELRLEEIDMRAAGGQDAPRLRLLGNREQQVLQPDGIVAPVGRQAERPLDRLDRLGSEGYGTLTHVWLRVPS
jgi:hypothetical protein